MSRRQCQMKDRGPWDRSTARAKDYLQGVSPSCQGTAAESRKVLVRQSRHNIKCSPSYVTLPACLSIHHSVSRHLQCKIAILPLVCNSELHPSVTGHEFTLEFRSILERYVEMGLETLWVSPYCSQSLLQSLLQAGCRQS